MRFSFYTSFFRSHKRKQLSHSFTNFMGLPWSHQQSTHDPQWFNPKLLTIEHNLPLVNAHDIGLCQSNEGVYIPMGQYQLQEYESFKLEKKQNLKKFHVPSLPLLPPTRRHGLWGDMPART